MRDNVVFLLKGAAEDWKKKNNRALWTFELDVYSALTEAAEAIEELQKTVDSQDKIIANQDKIITEQRAMLDNQARFIRRLSEDRD